MVKRFLVSRLVPVLVLAAVAAMPVSAGDKKGGGESKPQASKWGPEHTGAIPFVIGFEKGKKEAEFSGKPMFVFFTATW